MKTLVLTTFSILFCCISSLNFLEVIGCTTPDANSYKFDNNWTLNNGAGEISFTGKGRGAYIKINNNNSDLSNQYWIIIAGWDNTMSKVIRGDGSTVCEIPQTVDTIMPYQYKLVLNPSASRIELYLGLSEAWTCIDEKSWNAPQAKYFSLSKSADADMMYCNITSKPLSEPVDTCFVPNPTTFELNNQWTLAEGFGSLIFNGYGKELYLRLIDSNSDSYQYWIILGLNGNQTKITRGDGSLVCLIDQVIDLHKTVNYNIVFDKILSSMTLFVDHKYIWTCTDPNGWNAPNVHWIGLSRSSESFYQMCDVQTVKISENGDYTQLMMTKTAK
jgi:hypothetical protein